LTLLATACGSGSSSHPHSKKAAARGGALFTQVGCASCHTLAAAHASGSVGPNLDQLKPDEATVARQIRKGGNGMPSFKSRLSPAQIAALASYVAKSAKKTALIPQSFGSIAAGFKPSGLKVSTCGRNWRCYEQAFGNLSYHDGARAALTTFARDMHTNHTVLEDCHLIAHAIGAGAYVRYRDAGRAFVAAGPLAMTCASGFYHGVLQRALHGVQPGNLAGAARRLCSSQIVMQNSFVLSQCLHGLGHGLMIFTGYDLPRALRTCDKLPDRYDQTTCTGGVFMENFTTSLGIRSPWLKASDPLFPCDFVGRKDKLYCYLQITSHLLDVTKRNWRAVVAWCRRSEAGWVRTCFQSLGRDVSGSTLSDPRGILRLCRLAGDMESECVYGAARDIANTDASARRATPFCLGVPSRMQAYCFEGIGSIVGGLHVYGQQRKAECRADVPRKYWQDCYEGANA
jgi:cytochrome c553